MEKTNAIRLLTIANIVFNVHEYDENETDGCKVASLLSLSEDEARYIGFTKKSVGGEQTKTFTFDNVGKSCCFNAS